MTLTALVILCLAFVVVLIAAVLKSGSDADDDIEAWQAMPDLHVERHVRRTRVVAENRG